MSVHRNTADRPAIVQRHAAQKKILEGLGWKFTKRSGPGWRASKGDKVFRVNCCVDRLLNIVLAYEATGK